MRSFARGLLCVDKKTKRWYNALVLRKETCPVKYTYPLLTEEYLYAAEPEIAARATAWDVAMGLQAVDGLEVSEYLREVACEQIEGHIGFAEVQERIRTYYAEQVSESSQQDEADKVAANIAELLHEDAFHFSPAGFAAIHKRLFHNVFKFAGKIREYNISKREWVLAGESVQYAHASDIIMALDYDMQRERRFSFASLSKEKMVEHIAHFIADIWQVHPFPEGNTRTTAVFCIKYLRYLGFQVNNEPFARHARYFRNALVRANYTNVPAGIDADYSFLIKFFRNLLYEDTCELLNRHMHIHYAETGQVSGQRPGQAAGQVEGKIELPDENICALVRALGAGQMSVRELMAAVGLKGRDNFVSKHLNPAVSGGYLCLLYPDSPRHPRQKYRLTPRGCLVWDRLHR